MERDLDVISLFKGLTRPQAVRFRECVIAVLPALREAVVETTKESDQPGEAVLRIRPDPTKRKETGDMR